MLDWSTKDSKTESGFFEWLFKISTTFLHWQTHKALRISFASNLFFKPLGGGFFWPTCNGNSCLPPLENSMPCTAWVSLGGPI